jgi:hypothetical protein
MLAEFIPKAKDEVIKSHYPSGKIREEKYVRDGKPANGWSRKSFYENGKLALHECFSHELVIEQLFYSEEGELTAHKIYSHSQKKLIDKPKVTVVQRPNVVDGCAHMGFYYKHMPAISEFIGAEYKQEDLEKAYNNFINTPYPNEEKENAGDEWDDQIVTWRLQGKNMSFLIGFEHGEGYYHWNLRASNETDYEKARNFMESLV